MGGDARCARFLAGIGGPRVGGYARYARFHSPQIQTDCFADSRGFSRSNKAWGRTIFEVGGTKYEGPLGSSRPQQLWPSAER